MFKKCLKNWKSFLSNNLIDQIINLKVQFKLPIRRQEQVWSTEN